MATTRATDVEVNTAASTVVVDYASLIATRATVVAVPIDKYYERARELVRFSSEPWCSQHLMGLLTVDLIGTVELYVRSVLVGVIRICPVAKKLTARKQVPIAAATYYPLDDLAYATLDHQALSDSKAISNATQTLLGFPTSGSGSLEAALSAFDRVCHLRHAITHQNGYLGPHNLLELGVEAPGPAQVLLDGVKFQQLVATCHSLVRALNQFLFERLVERWAKERLLVFDWTTDEARFRGLCALLVSSNDLPSFDPARAHALLTAGPFAARSRGRPGP